MFSSVAISLNVAWIKLSHSFIVKFKPFSIAFLDVAKIMTELSSSIMKDNSFQSKFIFLSILSVQLFIECVVIYVKLHWEFPAGVYLFILKLIVVKANSLKVDHEVVRKFSQNAGTSNISLFAAGVTLIIGNNFTLNKLFKGTMNILVPFYLQRKRIEALITLINSLTISTDSLSTGLSSKIILNNVRERRSFEAVLDLVEEDVKELLSILLNGDIDRHSFEIFERKAEFLWIIVLFFSEFEMSE